MSDDIRKEQYRGYAVRVVVDDEPMDPTDCDNWISNFYHWHRRHLFCKRATICETPAHIAPVFDRIKKGVAMAIPVALFEHGDCRLYEGKSAHPQDPGGWDSGHVGFLVVEKKAFVAACGRGKWKDKEFVLKQLRDELEVLRAYVAGESYGWIAELPNGEHLDSCYGFTGESIDSVLEFAKQAVDVDLYIAEDDYDHHAPVAQEVLS